MTNEIIGTAIFWVLNVCANLSEFCMLQQNGALIALMRGSTALGFPHRHDTYALESRSLACRHFVTGEHLALAFLETRSSFTLMKFMTVQLAQKICCITGCSTFLQSYCWRRQIERAFCLLSKSQYYLTSRSINYWSRFLMIWMMNLMNCYSMTS